jgi:hypothetical protein
VPSGRGWQEPVVPAEAGTQGSRSHRPPAGRAQQAAPLRSAIQQRLACTGGPPCPPNPYTGTAK